LNLTFSKSYLILTALSFLYIFSLPPFGISIFYFLSVSGFLYFLIHNKNIQKKQIFFYFFLAQFISLSWIIQSFYTGGLGYLVLGLLLVITLASFVACLHFIVIFFVQRLYPNEIVIIFLLPLSFTIVEILKEFILGGFPWNPSPVIYFNNWAVLQLVPSLGVYGLSLLIHLIVGLILLSIIKKNLIIFITLILGTLFIMALSLWNNNSPTKSNSAQESLNIAIIQPNIYESLVQFDVLDNLEKYSKITKEALSKEKSIDLVIWPEGALPIDLNNREGLLQRIGGLLEKNQRLILGSSAIEGDLLYNRLYMINAMGEVEQFYDKQKLVLFGEYVPWIKPLVSRFLNLGMNYSPGREQKIIQLPKNTQAIPMICFESIFHYPSINSNICNTDLVLQISNDSWFGQWYGPHQHLANSLLRSVEFNKSLIRSTPSGISAVIDKEGNIIKKIKNNQAGYIYYEYSIEKYSGASCVSTMNYIIFILIFLYSSLLIYVRIKR